MLSIFVILTLVFLIITPVIISFAQPSDTIQLTTTLKEGNFIEAYLYFQETNMSLGEGNKLCPQDNCLYEFERTSFDNLFGDESRTFSGTLKIEDKENSEVDYISYEYYKMSGTFDLINSEENPETGSTIFIYKGDLGFEMDDEIFGTKKIEYESQVKLYQPENKLQLIGKIKN